MAARVRESLPTSAVNVHSIYVHQEPNVSGIYFHLDFEVLDN